MPATTSALVAPRRQYRARYCVYTVATRNIVSTLFTDRRTARRTCDQLNSSARVRQYRVGRLSYNPDGEVVASRPHELNRIPQLTR